MSTRVTLKHGAVHGTTFHLYDDVMDELAGVTDPPVHLRIDGVEVELRTLPDGGASVLLALPREVASLLGLVSSPERPSKEGSPDS